MTFTFNYQVLVSAFFGLWAGMASTLAWHFRKKWKELDRAVMLTAESFVDFLPRKTEKFDAESEAHKAIREIAEREGWTDEEINNSLKEVSRLLSEDTGEIDITKIGDPGTIQYNAYHGTLTGHVETDRKNTREFYEKRRRTVIEMFAAEGDADDPYSADETTDSV
ncbi:hypothetical protein GCM10010423_64900 [Streptomyces levis]|uniref:Uncharacterized protein n=1 Tax=Streptomyces levis TaxID=285566 RepID=A0ABN3P182_9ACTN